MKLSKVLSGILTVVLSAVCVGGMAPSSAVLAEDPLAEPPFTEEKLEFTASNGQTLAYYLVKPRNFDADSSYPLVVYLHGVGGDTDTSGYEALKKQLFSRGLNCVFLAPLADWNGGQTWIDYAEVLAQIPPCGTYDQSSLSITPALLAAKELIESTKTVCHTDPARSYVLGVSMGGYGTWDLVTRYPDLMTAAVPICGGCDPTTASRVKDLPIWMFHGTEDAAVEVSCSQEMTAALIEAGSGVVKYTEYDGLDHGIWFKVFEEPEMLPWLFAQGTGIRDDYADLSKTGAAQNVTVETGRVFGDTTVNCLVRGTGEGSVAYTAEGENTIADARLRLTLMYDDVAYYMAVKGYASINDLIRLEVRSGAESAWTPVSLTMSKPVTLGLVAGGAYTYSSVLLTPETALPEGVTAVRYVFSEDYTNWYMMASGAEILYRPVESVVEWVEPEPDNTDTWDGVTMTEGWNGVDDFDDLSHTVDSSNVKTLSDPYVKQTVVAKEGHGPVGYFRYAQKNCYITDLTLYASLIEGFLPEEVGEWLTVSVRVEGSDKDTPIAMSKTAGTLLYENAVPAYNYYSSVITPAAPLPDKVISVKIELGASYINYTMYMDKAELTFEPISSAPSASSTESSETTEASATETTSTETSATKPSGNPDTTSPTTRETEAAAPVTTQPAEQPPKTGDAPAVGGLLLAAISGTAAVLCLRRRKAEG